MPHACDQPPTYLLGAAGDGGRVLAAVAEAEAAETAARLRTVAATAPTTGEQEDGTAAAEAAVEIPSSSRLRPSTGAAAAGGAAGVDAAATAAGRGTKEATSTGAEAPATPKPAARLSVGAQVMHITWDNRVEMGLIRPVHSHKFAPTEILLSLRRCLPGI